MEKSTGTIKFFNIAKGFGFIVPDGGGPELFVHVSNLEGGDTGPVNEGDKVIFSSYAGTEVKIDGEEYLIMKEDDILAVLE